nr:hypothetical protein [Actinomycetales bacterium]
MPAPDPVQEHALAESIRGIEQSAANEGWDGPVRVFALVETVPTAQADPQFAAQLLEPDLSALPPAHLTPVEQQGLPEADTLEELLARLAWPEAVAGAACVVERLVLASDDGATLAPTDALSSPQRRDLRIAAGVLRSGASWCVLRLRSNDDPAMRLQGADVVPGLVEQLRSTLAPLPPGPQVPASPTQG